MLEKFLKRWYNHHEMENSILKKRPKFNGLKRGMKPATLVSGTFLLLIGIGTLLLYLPISHNDGQSFTFVQSLFTATSAVCVTGLVVADTFTQFSFFGQLVIILLIQGGGLGIMTLATLFFIFAGKKITLKERLVLQEAYSQNDLSGLVRLTIRIVKYAFTIEAIGAVILSLCFIGDFGFIDGVWKGIFHSISAFCNAGFDLIGLGNSLTSYYNNPVVLFTIMGLIVLGGIGFCVIIDFINHKKEKRRLFLHTRVAVIMTIILIVVGTIVFLFAEWNNPNTIGNMNLFDKVLSSLFQSVTTRTAGFNTIDQGALTGTSNAFSNLLMFIGASPGGTGGGIKTTTFFVVLVMFVAGARGREDVVAFKHSIKFKTALKAFSIMISALTIVFVTSMLVYNFEALSGNTITYQDVLFEAFSAFGTVGLSTGITPSLSNASLIVVSITMYLGRIGALLLSVMFVGRNSFAVIKYSDYRMIIG